MQLKNEIDYNRPEQTMIGTASGTFQAIKKYCQKHHPAIQN